MAKPPKHKSILYHWVAWVVAIEIVHVFFAVQAAYERGVPLSYLIEQFKIMYEIPLLNYIVIVIAALMFAMISHYLNRTRRPLVSDSTCQHCGYSLDGLPHDTLCPECGET